MVRDRVINKSFKKICLAAFLVLFMFGISSAVSAETIFFDGFSSTHPLDDGWSGAYFQTPYSENLYADIYSNNVPDYVYDDYYAVMKDEAAMYRQISTVGYSDINFAYCRRTALSSSTSDRLRIGWKTGSFSDDWNDWNELENIRTNTWSCVDFDLPYSAENTNIWIAFFMDDGNTDYGLVDNVHLTGELFECTNDDDCEETYTYCSKSNINAIYTHSESCINYQCVEEITSSPCDNYPLPETCYSGLGICTNGESAYCDYSLVFSDNEGPNVYDLLVDPNYNNGIFDITATIEDECSPIRTAEYFLRHSGSLNCGTPGTGTTIYPEDDGSYDLDNLIEYVKEENVEFIQDGSNRVCMQAQDEEYNWGECVCYYFESDTIPPEVLFGVTLNGVENPNELLVCDIDPQLELTVCDSQSEIQGGEFFLNMLIPPQPIPAPWSGYWLEVVNQYPNQGGYCAELSAYIPIDGAGHHPYLDEGTHYINQIRGKDIVENWGKVWNQNFGYSFIVDRIPPKVFKEIDFAGDIYVPCTGNETDLPYGVELTDDCYYVKQGTTITLTAYDFNPDDDFNDGWNNLPGQYAGDVELFYKVWYKENDTSDWELIDYGSNIVGGQATITLEQDSYHLIEYWAVDACGHESEHRFELDIVDTKAPLGIKTVGTPKISCEDYLQGNFGNNFFGITGLPPRTGSEYILGMETLGTGDGPCIDATQPNQCAYVSSTELPYYAVETLKAEGGDMAAISSGCGNILILSSGDPLDGNVDISTNMGNPGCGLNPDGYQTFDCVDLTYTPEADSFILAISSEWPEYAGSSFTDWMRIGDLIDVSINNWGIPNTIDTVGPYSSGTRNLGIIGQGQSVALRVADSGDHILDTALIVVPMECFDAPEQSLLCGNGVIDPGEECEYDTDCLEGQVCRNCLCVTDEPIECDYNYWVTDETEITLQCVDQDPHPVGGEKLFYRISFDVEPWLTLQYCSEFGGNYYAYGSDGWCEVDMNEFPEGYTFNFREDSVHGLEFYCEDALENTNEINEQIYKVDTIPPETTKTYGLPFFTDGTNSWISSQTAIMLFAEDGGPICAVGGITTKYRYYQVEDYMCSEECNQIVWSDNAPEWEIYSGPFTIPTMTCHYIEYFSKDALGNTENLKWQCIFVDNEPPETIKTVGYPKLPGFEWEGWDIDWFIRPETTITFDCDDGSGSGCSDTLYRIRFNSGSWSEWENYTEPFTLGNQDGVYELEYYSLDNVYNKEDTHLQIYKIDTIPPETTKTYEGISLFGWRYMSVFDITTWMRFISSDTEIVLEAEDSQVGVGNTYYQILVPSDEDSDICYPNEGVCKSMAIDTSEKHCEWYGHNGDNNGTWYETLEDCEYEYCTATVWEVISPQLINGNGCSIVGQFEGFNYPLGLWCLYEDPITIEEECDHKICYFSDDELGNAEDVHCQVFSVDNRAPEIEILQPSGPTETWLGCGSNMVSVEADISEDKSGINNLTVYAQLVRIPNCLTLTEPCEDEILESVLMTKFPDGFWRANVLHWGYEAGYNYFIRVVAQDNMGNEGSSQEQVTLAYDTYFKWLDSGVTIEKGSTAEMDVRINLCHGGDAVGLKMSKLCGSNWLNPRLIHSEDIYYVEQLGYWQFLTSLEGDWVFFHLGEDIINQYVDMKLRLDFPENIEVSDTLECKNLYYKFGAAYSEDTSLIQPYRVYNGLGLFEVSNHDTTITIGTNKPAPEPYCGDGICDIDEDCETCPQDCGECESPPSSGDSGTGTSGGGSSGGFSGGGGGAAPFTQSVSCQEDWDCTEWNECNNGMQTRTCVDLNNCETSENKPMESRICTVPTPETELGGDTETIAVGTDTETPSTTVISRITGAVVGTFKDTQGAFLGITFLFLLIAAGWFVSKKKSNKKEG